MSEVRIITDSTNSLPKTLIQQYGIEVVPFLMTVGTRVYRDEIDIDVDQMLEMLPTLEKIPTMSGANPGEFVQLYRKLATQTNQILCVVTSKVFSVTYASAATARNIVLDQNPDLNIEILDSQTCSGSLGFIALEAARAAAKGNQMSEIIQTARAMIPRVKHYTGMHSLKYLSHAGRVPKTMIPPGDNDPLDMKTVISVNTANGQIEFTGKYAGIEKTLEAMIEKAKQRLKPELGVHFMAHYTNDIKVAETLRDMALANFYCVENYVTRHTAVMSCSTGPQYGISFYQ